MTLMALLGSGAMSDMSPLLGAKWKCRQTRLTSAFDFGFVKTLGGITAPGILGSTVMRRAKNAKICLPLGITTKSDFVFTHGVIPG